VPRLNSPMKSPSTKPLAYHQVNSIPPIKNRSSKSARSKNRSSERVRLKKRSIAILIHRCWSLFQTCPFTWSIFGTHDRFLFRGIELLPPRHGISPGNCQSSNSLKGKLKFISPLGLAIKGRIHAELSYLRCTYEIGRWKVVGVSWPAAATTRRRPQPIYESFQSWLATVLVFHWTLSYRVTATASSRLSFLPRRAGSAHVGSVSVYPYSDLYACRRHVTRVALRSREHPYNQIVFVAGQTFSLHARISGGILFLWAIISVDCWNYVTSVTSASQTQFISDDILRVFIQIFRVPNFTSN